MCSVQLFAWKDVFLERAARAPSVAGSANEKVKLSQISFVFKQILIGQTAYFANKVAFVITCVRSSNLEQYSRQEATV